MVKTLERLTAVLRTVSLMLFCGLAPALNAQTDKVIADLVSMGFENVRCTEDSAEVVYSVENNVYKIQAVGVAKAIRKIQSEGLVEGKKCDSDRKQYPHDCAYLQLLAGKWQGER